MTDIQIDNPFNLTINIIEIDNYIPSFKIELIYKNKGINYSFNDEINFWIECNKWDSFYKQLIEEEEIINLTDMNNVNRINFQLINENYLISINNSISSISINNINIYEHKIEKEIFKQIVEKIKIFPKWW